MTIFGDVAYGPPVSPMTMITMVVALYLMWIMRAFEFICLNHSLFLFRDDYSLF
jgi:hypothetical protein